MRKYNTILFDLDGTLLDTVDGITEAINTTLKAINSEKVADIVVTKKCLGYGAKTLIKKLSDMIGLTSLETDNFSKKYPDIYTRIVNEKTKSFAGVEETLKILKKQGYNLAVISNKPNRDVPTCIEKYFPNMFDFYVGQMEGIPPKPHKDMFFKMVELYHFKKESTIYVGDMDIDIEFSKNVGMKVIVCKHGYGTIESIKDADYLIDDFNEIITILEKENEKAS